MGCAYIKLGEKSKAMSIIAPTCDELLEYLRWYESLSARHRRAIASDHEHKLNMMRMMMSVIAEGGESYGEELKHYNAEFSKYLTMWRNKNKR